MDYALEEIVKQYQLPREDVFQHKDGWKIISANGIRRMIYIRNIKTTKRLDYYNHSERAAVVNCRASLDIDADTSRTHDSFGEASILNSTFKEYIVNVAEKRAEGRAVLNVLGMYAHGWRAEEEFDELVKGEKIIEKRREQSQAAINHSIDKIEKPKITKRALSSKKKTQFESLDESAEESQDIGQALRDLQNESPH